MTDSSGVGGRLPTPGLPGRTFIPLLTARGEGGTVCIVCVGEYPGGGVTGAGGIPGGILSGVEDLPRTLMIPFCSTGLCPVLGIVFCLLTDITWGPCPWTGGREFCLVRELVSVGVLGADTCCLPFCGVDRLLGPDKFAGNTTGKSGVGGRLLVLSEPETNEDIQDMIFIGNVLKNRKTSEHQIPQIVILHKIYQYPSTKITD